LFFLIQPIQPIEPMKLIRLNNFVTMKKMFFFPLTFLLFPFALNALESNRAEIKILSSTLSETILEIQFPALQRSGNGAYDISSLPYVSGIIAVSDRGAFKGEIERSDGYSIHLREPVSFSVDAIPERQLYLDTPQILRDYRILRFQFFPIQYSRETNEIRVTRNVIIRIRKTAPGGKNEKPFRRKRISQAFYNIYRNSILNFKFFERFTSDTILYVIITPDTYYDDMLPFKEWKEETGIITKMVKFSEISPSPTYYDIRNYMLNAYNNWEHPPDYFLAVGDADVFPVKYTGSYANDNYYVALDSINDIFPDIFGGRLPINNTFELQTVINKIINYEQNPYMAETNWYKKAVMIASDEFPSQAVTKVWVREQFILEGGYEYVDTIFAIHYSSSSAIGNDITNVVNEGRGFLNYRGPGWSSSWYASFGQIYHISNVQSLNNGRKLPVVTSCGCGVAKFDVSTCFGEQWVRNGTPTSEKGAVSFFGPTSITHTRHNNKLDRGIYKGIFQEGLTSFGEATVRGKLYMYEICGMSDTTISQMNTYLILGDPTLLLRTDVPESMVVSHPSLVPIGESILWVSVGDIDSPLTNAFVCAKMDSVFHSSGHTDSTGAVGLTIFPTIVDTVFVSVVAQNHFYYKGFCLVNANGPWPGFCKYVIDDDTIGTSYGNDDGIPNPGEKLELPLMLKNYGNEEATDVSALLSSDDNVIVITDSVELFGNIPAGDSALSGEDYDFTISTSAPDQHTIFFELKVHDTNDSIWISHFKVTILAPVLELVNFTVDDSGQSNPNGILDPGETVELTCRLKNSGSAEAIGVTAKLRPENIYIECIDSVSAYGDFLPGNEKDGTPFIIKANSSTPVGYNAEMKLLFSSNEAYADSTLFIIKVGVGGDFLIWDPDENYSSGPKIKIALEASGYTGEYSTTLSDYLDILRAFKAVFICLGVWPNNKVLSGGQFVDSLCSFLDNGGRIYMEGADTWAYDSPTTLHSYFNILGLQDGSDDTYSISGVSGTFTNQMSFTYTGENSWMDHLGTTGGSFVIFNNLSPSYTNGVAYDAGTYRTVGTSFEFGGLTDGTPPSTKEALADSIMRFFGISGTQERPEENQYPAVFSLSRNYPNPFSCKTTFTYSIPLRKGERPLVKKSVTFNIFDITGRKIRTLVDEGKSPGLYTIVWDGTDDFGKGVSQGVYFTRLTIENEGLHKTRKIVLIK